MNFRAKFRCRHIRRGSKNNTGLLSYSFQFCKVGAQWKRRCASLLVVAGICEVNFCNIRGELCFKCAVTVRQLVVRHFRPHNPARFDGLFAWLSLHLLHVKVHRLFPYVTAYIQNAVKGKAINQMFARSKCRHGSPFKSLASCCNAQKTPLKF